MKKTNKRGSHVGMIMSFVIFIVFLMMLYVTFQPSLKLKESKKQELDYIKNKIIENVSETVVYEIYSYNNTSPKKDCLSILYSIPKNFIAKNSRGESLNSYLDGTQIYVLAEEGDKKIIKITYLENTTTTNAQCNNFIDESRITKELSQSRKEIIEGRIISLIETNRRNYSSIKKNLGISEGTEFNLEFAYENGTKINSEKIPKTNNVFAENIPVQYLNTSADINRGIISIQVW